MPISERFSTSIGIIKSSSKSNEHYPCHPYWSTNKMEPKSDGRTSRITFIYFKFQNNGGQTQRTQNRNIQDKTYIKWFSKHVHTRSIICIEKCLQINSSQINNIIIQCLHHFSRKIAKQNGWTLATILY